MLAGVSIDYYTQLERGKLAGVSDTVLDAIAGALQLDEAERAHLFDLARAANAAPGGPRTRRRADRPQVRPGRSMAFEAMELSADVRSERDNLPDGADPPDGARGGGSGARSARTHVNERRPQLVTSAEVKRAQANEPKSTRYTPNDSSPCSSV
jgi:transcriptional regulator with XRE-family HTH domain